MKSTPKFVLRANILPQNYSEYPLFIFVVLIIPLTYWFEIWVVFLSLFPPPSIVYYIFFILGLFEIHNVVGNFLGLLMCDTSIRGRTMPDENTPGVKYCTVCEIHAPPRSYHCPMCDVCILKRDHHCIFTSCCIGHYNQRYFMNFLLHICLSVVVSLPFNVYFLYHMSIFGGFSFITSLVFPVVLLIVDMGPDNIQVGDLYVALFGFQIFGLVFCFSWMAYHGRLILHGKIVHENRHFITAYDLGTLKNVEMVFGKRWYLTWISPFISSELPCDGIYFPMKKDPGVHEVGDGLTSGNRFP